MQFHFEDPEYAAASSDLAKKEYTILTKLLIFPESSFETETLLILGN